MNSTINKTYDAFIAVANQDLEQGKKLYESLQLVGAKLWFPQVEGKIGDDTFDLLNQGMQRSQYVIVLLSKNFLKNTANKNTLQAWLQQDSKRQSILPVFHEIEQEQVTEVLPIIGSRLAGNTAQWNDLIRGLKDALDINHNLEGSILISKSQTASENDSSQYLTGSTSQGPIIEDKTEYVPHELPKRLQLWIGAGILLLLTFLVVESLTDRSITFSNNSPNQQKIKALIEARITDFNESLDVITKTKQRRLGSLVLSNESAQNLFNELYKLGTGHHNAYEFSNGIGDKILYKKNLQKIGIQVHTSSINDFGLAPAEIWQFGSVQRSVKKMTISTGYLNQKVLKYEIKTSELVNDSTCKIKVAYKNPIRAIFVDGNIITGTKTIAKRSFYYHGFKPIEIFTLKLEDNSNWIISSIN